MALLSYELTELALACVASVSNRVIARTLERDSRQTRAETLATQAKLAFPRPNVLSIMAQCSEIIFLTRQKQRNRFPNLKVNLSLCLPPSRSDSIICMCVYLKLVLSSSKLAPTYIVELAILNV